MTTQSNPFDGAPLADNSAFFAQRERARILKLFGTDTLPLPYVGVYAQFTNDGIVLSGPITATIVADVQARNPKVQVIVKGGN